MPPPAEFGAAFKAFLEASVAGAPAEESELYRRIRDHLGTAPDELPVLGDELADFEHRNLQVALDALLDQPGWSHELIGLNSPYGPMMAFGLRQLVVPVSPSLAGPGAARPGPVAYANAEIEAGQPIGCVSNGLYLVQTPDGPVAATVSRQDRGMGATVQVEAAAAERDRAERFLADVRRLIRERNVFRGRVLSFARDMRGQVELAMHAVPAVERDGVILPPGTLETIERHVIAPARHREALLAAGRHLKRGLLLHGPPGTGKTLSVMYLIGQLPGRTVALLSGQGLGALEPACHMARELQPSMVVIEDVDLIAQERTYPGAVTPLLFELLNQMDGLEEDADVVFVLTTNRRDLLEPALAARPGRVDQAVELPLPDEDALRRLIALYARGLDVRTDLDRFVPQITGVSPAFVKEWLRRAVLAAAEADGAVLVVEERHLDEALAELRESAGTLFGAQRESDA